MATDSDSGVRRNLWVFGPGRDLALLIATPFLIAPVVFLVQSREAAYAAGLLVAGFGALGHHLPGMMRAYGDRALFRRFRARFLLAPAVFLTAALGFGLNGLNGVSIVVLLWGVWHGALQAYGFLRIYDARAGAAGRLNARLDFLTCVGWFGAGVLHSTGRMGEILELFYALGGPLVPHEAFLAFRTGWDAVLVVLTAAFVWRAVRDLIAGTGQHPVKLLAAASACGFWWWCSVSVPHAVLGVALFEIFHDVQYLSIVWAFNRRRAKDAAAGAFTRALFGGGRAMIFLYVGLVFAYGLPRFLPELTAGETLARVVFALVAASTMLHFYFDGFIWKVREPETGRALGIRERPEGAPPPPRARARRAFLTPHAAKWAGLFVLPLVLLFGLESRGSAATFPERYRNLTTLLPDSAEFHHNYAFALRERGDLASAEEHYRRAIGIDPEYPRAHANLGIALLARGAWEEAAEHLQEAVRLDDDYAAAHHNLGFLRERTGARMDAENHFRRAIELDPSLLEPRLGLARMLLASGNGTGAEKTLRDALERTPDAPAAHRELGLILARRGAWPEAVSRLETALAASPDDPAALEAAAWILAVSPSLRNPERAVAHARRASDLRGNTDASAADTLGAALAAAGDFEAALVAARTAEALAVDGGNLALAREIGARVALYEAGRPVTIAGEETGGAADEGSVPR